MLHRGAGLRQRRFLRTAHDLYGHDFADGGPFRVSLFGDHSLENVALGEDAHHLLLIEYDQAADMVFAHQQRSLQDSRGLPDRPDVRTLVREKASNGVHDALLFWVEMSYR